PTVTERNPKATHSPTTNTNTAATNKKVFIGSGRQQRDSHIQDHQRERDQDRKQGNPEPGRPHVTSSPSHGSIVPRQERPRPVRLFAGSNRTRIARKRNLDDGPPHKTDG